MLRASIGLLLLLALPGSPGPPSPQAAPAPLVELTIAAVPGLQYDTVRFAAAPGAEVRLTFENLDDLAHNLLVTLPGRREAVVEAALLLGNRGPDVDYRPDSEDVLFATPLIEPGGSFVLTFTAPAEEGIYPYVCTMPGHGYVMYGALYVTTSDLPPIEEDPHVPPRELVDAARSGHPYPLELPALYRTFMPDSGPASIAVGLEGGLSYCWDAGTSMLRYAWRGGFVDQTQNWRGKGAGRARIVGRIFYRNQAGFPLRLADPDSLVPAQFLGYRLVEGRPEFRYRLGPVTVRESIAPDDAGRGLAMTFELEGNDAPVWYLTTPTDGVAFAASAGAWDRGRLRLSPDEARRFTVTLLPADAPAP